MPLEKPVMLCLFEGRTKVVFGGVIRVVDILRHFVIKCCSDADWLTRVSCEKLLNSEKTNIYIL